jgi:hypothetical protein
MRARDRRLTRQQRISVVRWYTSTWPLAVEAPDALWIARLYGVPYRLISSGLINKPLIHKGRKPRARTA